MKKESKFSSFFGTKHFSLLVVIVLLLIVFSVFSEGRVFNPMNIRSIFNGMVITSFFTLGGGMLILFGYIDLSCGAVGSLAGCVVGWGIMTLGMPAPVSMLAGIAASMLCGFVNAVMVNKLNFEAFIATMAMASVVHGVGYNLVSAQGLPIESDLIRWIGNTKIFNQLLPITVIVAVVFFVVCGVILGKTRFGRTVYLCGGNKQAARLSGLKPKRLSYILFTLSGGLAGVCGVLAVSRVGTSYATALDSYQFTGLTAAMLGGIAFGGGSGDMLGAFFGMLIISIFNNGTTLLGLDKNLATIFNGLLLVMALAVDAVSARQRAKSWVRKSMAEM
ncbi:MAG: ABC transporter permease [Oscillospiraceae bacterium]|jgi:ribose/xylose/arabinose/galactoside ABC-type transport system permease subunit|nr:ABC transporter permease [Oscillospiraceae bacterium]